MSDGGREYEDVRSAALWLRNQSAVDEGRVGVWGLSYGGLNALQAIARDSKTIFAVGCDLIGSRLESTLVIGSHHGSTHLINDKAS